MMSRHFGAAPRRRLVRALSRTVAVLTCTLCGASVSHGQCFQWAQVSEDGPGLRDHSAMVFDAQRGVAVLFGGQNDRFELLADTWTWNGSEWRLVAEAGPTPRAGHAMAYDSARGVIVLFGGGGQSGFLGDTWEWDGTRWELKATEGPSPRPDHAMAYDAARGVTVLFGGFDSTFGHLWDDTWIWDGSTWTQAQTSGPEGRQEHAMAYDPVRQVTVLFGGDAPFNRLGDTWEWNGLQWRQVATSGPSARYLHSMTWHESRRTVLLFGGVDGSRRGDTWEWNGVAWRLLSNSGPPPRSQHAMTYDPTRDAAIIFGGRDRFNDHLGDTWETTGATLDIIQQPSDQTARGGGPASFTVVAEGRGELTYQWRRNGQSLVDGGTIIGSQTDTLTITRVFRSDAAEYDVKVTGECGTLTSERATLSVVDPSLSVNAACPDGGSISVSWQYATPSGAVALLYAGNTGRFRIPNAFECAGTQLGLGAQSLRVAWRGQTESDGSRTIFASTGPEACGGYMQLIDLLYCAPSNVARLE